MCIVAEFQGQTKAPRSVSDRKLMNVWPRLLLLNSPRPDCAGRFACKPIIQTVKEGAELARGTFRTGMQTPCRTWALASIFASNCCERFPHSRRTFRDPRCQPVKECRSTKRPDQLHGNESRHVHRAYAGKSIGERPDHRHGRICKGGRSRKPVGGSDIRPHGVRRHICQGVYLDHAAGVQPFDLPRLFAVLSATLACACYFVEILGQSQLKVSRHLAYLRRAGVFDRAARRQVDALQHPASGRSRRLSRSPRSADAG
jgi:hypothetical protein